ncbi:predicted protein [Uncinocarpus reesii 1704]|uniref:Uncharacterized protein n=1 Tax=Uncinocarpus reesii (strain UAMH 1704) TaxID=336963 RepID=C4JU02_UNCRE|nr:uncharacterized protein UREG_05941 [Uncinocarpus reesii 1704]EEP81099.1 predicted protein [Uncinocarpus reesii 1704]
MTDGLETSRAESSSSGGLDMFDETEDKSTPKVKVKMIMSRTDLLDILQISTLEEFYAFLKRSTIKLY